MMLPIRRARGDEEVLNTETEQLRVCLLDVVSTGMEHAGLLSHRLISCCDNPGARTITYHSNMRLQLKEWERDLIDTRR